VASRVRPIEAAGEISRYLGAVALLLVAAVHAQQYYDAYFSVVPTIGTLFLLNVIGAGAAGLVLFAPVGLLRMRLADAILVLGALTGIVVAAGSFAALLISEYVPLFGFMESGYRLAIVLSLLFEGLATLLLVVFVVALVLDRRSAGRARDVIGRPLASTTTRPRRRRAAGASIARVTASRRPAEASCAPGPRRRAVDGPPFHAA
jgi:cation transport ATPase